MKDNWWKPGKFEREILERERQRLLSEYRSGYLSKDQARSLDSLNRQLGGTGDEVQAL